MLDPHEFCSICGTPVGVYVSYKPIPRYATVSPLEDPGNLDWCNTFRAVLRESSKLHSSLYLAPYVSDQSTYSRPSCSQLAIITQRPSTHCLESLVEETERYWDLAEDEIEYSTPARHREGAWPIYATFGLSFHIFCWTRLERQAPHLCRTSNSGGLLKLWHSVLSQDRDLGGAQLFHGTFHQWDGYQGNKDLPDHMVYFAEPELLLEDEPQQNRWTLLPDTRPFVPPEISHMITSLLDFQDLSSFYCAHNLPIPEFILRDRSSQFWDRFSDMRLFQARKVELKELKKQRDERLAIRLIKMEDPELCQEDIEEMEQEEFQDEAETVALKEEDQYAFYPPNSVLNYYRIDKIVQDVVQRCEAIGGDENLNDLLPADFIDPWP